MADEVKVDNGTPTPEPGQPTDQATSVFANSDQPVVDGDQTILDTAGEEEKAAAAAERQRIVDADPDTLSDEDKEKRDGFLREDEEARQKALAEEKAKGVPEKYEFKLPEGVTLEEARLEKVTPVFKELGLSNDMAQKLIDLDIQLRKEDAEVAEGNFKKFLADSTKETMEALGPNAKSELAHVARVKTYFSPETIDVLNSSGMGNIKSFIFDLAKIGRLLSEDKLADTGKGVAGGADVAGTLYPSMKK